MCGSGYCGQIYLAQSSFPVIRWGVDSVTHADQNFAGMTFFEIVKANAIDAPRFWGRYIGSPTASYNLVPSEIEYLARKNCRILLIYNGHTGPGASVATFADGQAAAQAAIDYIAINNLQVPGGNKVWIYCDLEASQSPTPAFFTGWFSRMQSSPYVGGVYGAPSHYAAYCLAYTQTTPPELFYSQQPQIGCIWSYRTFNPSIPSPCRARTAIHQYQNQLGCSVGTDPDRVDLDLADELGFQSMWAPTPRTVLWGRIANTIKAWDEGGNEVLSANWPASDPDGAPTSFIEGRDGSLYGIFASGSKIKKFNVVSSGIFDIALLVSFPSGWSGGKIYNPIMVRPDGTIYVHATSNSPSQYANPLNHDTKWMRLVYATGIGWSLVDEITTPQVFTDQVAHIFDWSATNQYVLSSETTGLSKRWLLPAILSTGRWVAADPIPFSGDVWDIENPPDASHYDYYLLEVSTPTTGTFPDGTFTTMTHRVWGDQWLERPGGTGAWVETSGKGAASSQIQLTVAIPPTMPRIKETSGATRIAQDRIIQSLPGILPVILALTRPTPEDTATPNTPRQSFVSLIADGTKVFLHMQGSYDANGIYQPGGIYSAAIPSPGSAPSRAQWTKIATEPISPPSSWAYMTVTKSYVWVLMSDAFQIYLIRMNKDGSGQYNPRTYAWSAPLVPISPAFPQRWR